MTLAVKKANAFVVSMIIHGVVGYDFVCPDRSHLRIYSKAACLNPLEFTCLKDALVFTHNEYRKSCYQSRPVAVGYKYVFRPWYDREKCDSDRYQPFIFYRNRQSDCFYLKSVCNEEGQIPYTHGSTTSDVQCKCDDKNGYTFVTPPKNKISCAPSEEDCSCYRKQNNDSNDAYNNQRPILTIVINDSMTGSLNERNTQFDDTKYNIKGVDAYRRHCAIVLFVTICGILLIFGLIVLKLNRFTKLLRCIQKKIHNYPPKDAKVIQRKQRKDSNTTVNIETNTLNPVEKLILKEYLFQLSPKEALAFARTLKSECVIDKAEYGTIQSCYERERNEHLRLITIDKILENCHQLHKVVYVLYNSGNDGQMWAKDLYNIYQARKTQIPSAVQRASVGHRQSIQHDFIKYKRWMQSLPENPFDFLKSIADQILLRIETEPIEEHSKLCDQYVVFVALAIDSLSNKTNNIDINDPIFAKINEVIPKTSCPALSRCLLYGRQAVILSFSNNRERGDDVVKEALFEEMSVSQSLETVDLYYKIVLYQRAWYEDHQEEITDKINNLSCKAMGILASKQDDVRLFWSRRFVVRQLYCYLGLGMRGRFIPGFQCSDDNLKESKRLLSCFDSDDAELRTQMIFCIAKARLFQLTCNKTEALEFITKAADIGLKGGFQAELRAIKESKKQIMQ